MKTNKVDKSKRIIALDIEGTIISNAISIFPRPGLNTFLEFLDASFSRIVVMTALEERIFRKIAKILCDEGTTPLWFNDLEYYSWKGQHELKYKDLRCIPDSDIQSVIIIDDMEEYIHPDQKQFWIQVQPFSAPYSKKDKELFRMIKILSKLK